MAKPLSKPLNIYTDFSVSTETMATITISMPEGFEETKKKFPEVNWNEVLKKAILRRLEELKKFENLKNRGNL